MRKLSFLFLYSHEPWLLPPSLELQYILSQSGHKLDIFFTRRSPVDQYFDHSIYDRVFENNLTSYVLIKRILFPLMLKRKVMRVIKVNLYDIVVACDVVSLQVLSSANIDSKKVYWAFELSGVRKILSISWDAYRSFRFSSFLKRMDIIICPSSERLSILQPLAEKVRLLIIRNFRAVKKVSTSETDRLSKPGIVRLVFAGRLSVVSDLCPIIEQVEKHTDKIRFVLVGKMDDQFKKWFLARSASNVVYKGEIENGKLISFLTEYDIAVCSYSRRDSVGLEARYPAPTKIGDAIAASCGLFCSDQPYLNELVEKYQLGFIYNDHNLSAVISKVASLTPVEIKTFKARSKMAFRTEYSMDEEVQKFLKSLEI